MAASDLDERFQAMTEFVSTWDTGKKATNGEKLNAYKFYKQATVGDVAIDRPGMFSFEARQKWDAWNSVKGISSEEAKEGYLKELEEQKEKYGE